MSAPLERVIVEADGGSRGNPGPAGYGAVVLDPGTGAVLAERSAAIGVDTNNVAEYRGLIAGLDAAHELGARRVAVRMDSKLVVEQMSGRWQVKHPGMRTLAREAADLLAGFDEVTFEWIPRERNKRADLLANQAMDAAAGKAPAPARAAAAPRPSSAGTWTPPTGPATKLILVRHGSTEHSAELRFSGRNELPLDDAGLLQAGALARRAGTFGRVVAVVSSPLLRARQTADAMAAAVGHDVRVDDDLTEVDFGDFEGLTFAEAREKDPDGFRAWVASPDVAPPNGESFADAARRFRRARDRIVAAHPSGVVIVVSHVTPIKTLVRLALDAPPSALFRMHLDTASVSRIDYSADGAASVRLLNDTAHLDATLHSDPMAP